MRAVFTLFDEDVVLFLHVPEIVTLGVVEPEEEIESPGITDTLQLEAVYVAFPERMTSLEEDMSASSDVLRDDGLTVERVLLYVSSLLSAESD